MNDITNDLKEELEGFNIRDLKIRIKSPSFASKNNAIAETHSIFNTRDVERKDADHATYGIRRMANNVAVTISPWTLLGYFRSGVTEYLISQGVSVCHGMDLTTVNKGDDYVDMARNDLVHGYHRKRMGEKNHLPECEFVQSEPCIVAKMFGGFLTHHRSFSMMPVKVTPVKSQYKNDVRNITGIGYYRNLSVAPRAFVDQTPYTFHSVDVIANLDAILYLRMYENNPLYVALLMRAVEFLNSRTREFDYNHQLGGSRTFGCGWTELEFLPPTLNRNETIKYHLVLMSREEKAASDLSEDTESAWENKEDKEETKEEIEEKGINKSISKQIDAWEDTKIKLGKLLDAEISRQRAKFGIDIKSKTKPENSWWEQEPRWLMPKSEREKNK